jgi:hypothetical protein
VITEMAAKPFAFASAMDFVGRFLPAARAAAQHRRCLGIRYALEVAWV